eukprot:jgi/Picsp_1/1375/NSC_04854-R1_---NA---
MCLFCCGGGAFLCWKASKALDSQPTQTVEPAFVTEAKLKYRLATISSRSDHTTSEIESSSDTRRRKVSAKELESKARLQDLIDRHAPSRNRK